MGARSGAVSVGRDGLFVDVVHWIAVSTFSGLRWIARHRARGLWKVYPHGSCREHGKYVLNGPPSAGRPLAATEMSTPFPSAEDWIWTEPRRVVVDLSGSTARYCAPTGLLTMTGAGWVCAVAAVATARTERRDWVRMLTGCGFGVVDQGEVLKRERLVYAEKKVLARVSRVEREEFVVVEAENE
jgi:hypothetical protein